MPIKTQSAKAKGRLHQQWVRDKILALFRKLEPSDVVSTGMGQAGEDVRLSPAARKLFPYSVECKSLKALSIYKIMRQAEANCPTKAEPVAIVKANREKPLAIIDAEHFFKLIGKNK